MSRFYKKMMRSHMQEELNDLGTLMRKPAPKKGWIHSIRQALGISGYDLAKRLGCAQSNVAAMEKREQAGSITLQSLEEAAKAMNCRFVYAFVPEKPLDEIREDQARKVVRRRLNRIKHTMVLEQQGLSHQQQKHQEDDLVRKLLESGSGKLWNDDDEV